MDIGFIKKKPKLKYIIIGYALGVLEFVYGIYMYHQFSHLEEYGGTLRIKWVIKFLYENFGKEVTCGLMFFTGAVIIAVVTAWIIIGKKEQRKDSNLNGQSN
jgi:hypothetical protein